MHLHMSCMSRSRGDDSRGWLPPSAISQLSTGFNEKQEEVFKMASNVMSVYADVCNMHTYVSTVAINITKWHDSVLVDLRSPSLTVYTLHGLAGGNCRKLEPQRGSQSKRFVHRNASEAKQGEKAQS